MMMMMMMMLYGFDTFVDDDDNIILIHLHLHLPFRVNAKSHWLHLFDFITVSFHKCPQKVCIKNFHFHIFSFI